MAVVIDVPNLHNSFTVEANRLGDYLSSLSRVNSDFETIGNDGSLSGAAYSAMKRYYLYIASPLLGYLKTAVETTKDANENANRCLMSCLGSEGVINVQQLSDICSKLSKLRQTLEDYKLEIEVFSTLLPGIGLLSFATIPLAIEGVRRLEQLYSNKLQRVYEFLQASAGMFGGVESSLAMVRSGIAAANAAYSGTGNCHYCTNGQVVRDWAKQIGCEDVFNEPSQEVMDWLNSLEGTSYDYDAWAGYGLQCFDLWIAYLDKLGCPRPTESLGAAKNIDDYIRNHPEMYPGWSVIDSPTTADYMVGDILIWEDGQWGHVAIVVAVNPDGSYEYVDYNGTGHNDAGVRHSSNDRGGAHAWNGTADRICRPYFAS